ncbi:MAG: ABC transporter substrate-binding protein [Propionibacteriaceae bacterium]|nr:ABC transporter substrate-binding protein [Propionibacteriaceae bacterium]
MKKIIGLAAAAALALAGCGTSAAERAAQSASAAPAASSAAASAAYPVEVDSCGKKLTFNAAPKTVLNLGGTGLPNLHALGVVDQIKFRAGNKNFGETQKELQAKYDAIPVLDSSELETGGARVSTETVLAAKVDLVIGYDTGVDREQLKKAGVQVYSPAAFCPDYSVEKATFSLIDTEITNLAKIFGVSDRATTVIGEQQKKIAALKSAGVPAGTTAAALYITPGDTKFYAYGTSSMVQPIFEANQLKNTYDDNTKRVFDASMEDLLKRNPEWIVLLSAEAGEAETLNAFKGFNGAATLQAMTKNQVVVLPFALTDPPSPLWVQGGVSRADKIAPK